MTNEIVPAGNNQNIIRRFLDAVAIRFGQEALERFLDYAEEQIEQGSNNFRQLVRNYFNSDNDEWVQGYLNTLNPPGDLDHIQTPQDLVRHNNEQRQISPVDNNNQLGRNVRRRIDFSQPNMQDTTQMDTSTASLRTASSSTNSGNYETPITVAQPSYSESETLTKYLPFTYWFTVARPTFVTPLEFEINLTHPQNMITFSSNMTVPTPGAAISKGFFTHNTSDTTVLTNWNNPLIAYPRTISATPQVQRPATIQWYSSRYKYYTVLNCHYKITMQNVKNTSNSDVWMSYGYNVSNPTKVGNVYPVENVNIQDEMYWKDLKSIIIPSKGTPTSKDRGIVILEGNYKPGQAKKNVENDGDVQRWTAIEDNGGLGIPKLRETFVARFYRAPFAQFDSGVIRVQVQLVYTIQFKDLNMKLSHPLNVTLADENLSFTNTDLVATGW